MFCVLLVGLKYKEVITSIPVGVGRGGSVLQGMDLLPDTGVCGEN